MLKRLFVGLVLAALAAPGAIIFTGSGGGRSASVAFSLAGGSLQVTLTNTALSPGGTGSVVPIDILTGVFFSITGNPGLTPVSAILPAGTLVCLGTSCGNPSAYGVTGGNVGGEWAFKSGSFAPGHLAASTVGISSSGLGIFGPPDLFSVGGSIWVPDSPDGLQAGLAPANYNPLWGNGGVQGNQVVVNRTSFTLSAPSLTALESWMISAVVFQYGTDTGEPWLPGVPDEPQPPVPEPATMGMLAAGLTGLFLWKRRRAGA